MKNKKIFILSGGGISNCNSAACARMSQYANCLSANRNVSIYIISYLNDDLHKAFISNNNNIFRLPPSQNKKNINPLNIWAFLNEILHKCPNLKHDPIIIYPLTNSLFEITFLLWSRFHRIKNIYYEANEVRFYWARLDTIPLVKRFIYKSIYHITELLTRYYKGLICINRNIQEYFLIHNNNSIVIPILSPINNRINKPSDNQIFTITFTGTISIPKENLDELLKGLDRFNKKYDNWKLNLYGITDHQVSLNQLYDLAVKLKLSSKINFCENLNQTEIKNILESSDCLILPRRNNKQNYYGFSTKLSEYLVSGTPVILTDTGVVSDYLTDGKDCIMVKGYEAEGFSKAFERLISMTQEQKSEMAYNAYLTASKHFNPYNYTTPFLKFLGIE